MVIFRVFTALDSVLEERCHEKKSAGERISIFIKKSNSTTLNKISVLSGYNINELNDSLANKMSTARNFTAHCKKEEESKTSKIKTIHFDLRLFYLTSAILSELNKTL